MSQLIAKPTSSERKRASRQKKLEKCKVGVCLYLHLNGLYSTQQLNTLDINCRKMMRNSLFEVEIIAILEEVYSLRILGFDKTVVRVSRRQCEDFLTFDIPHSWYCYSAELLQSWQASEIPGDCEKLELLDAILRKSSKLSSIGERKHSNSDLMIDDESVNSPIRSVKPKKSVDHLTIGQSILIPIYIIVPQSKLNNLSNALFELAHNSIEGVITNIDDLNFYYITIVENVTLRFVLKELKQVLNQIESNNLNSSSNAASSSMVYTVEYMSTLKNSDVIEDQQTFKNVIDLVKLSNRLYFSYLDQSYERSQSYMTMSFSSSSSLYCSSPVSSPRPTSPRSPGPSPIKSEHEILSTLNSIYKTIDSNRGITNDTKSKLQSVAASIDVLLMERECWLGAIAPEVRPPSPDNNDWSNILTSLTETEVEVEPSLTFQDCDCDLFFNEDFDTSTDCESISMQSSMISSIKSTSTDLSSIYSSSTVTSRMNQVDVCGNKRKLD